MRASGIEQEQGEVTQVVRGGTAGARGGSGSEPVLGVRWQVNVTPSRGRW